MPTARAHASPTASLTSSMTASSTPVRRARDAARSRAVRTCAGSAANRSSTVAIRGSGGVASVGGRDGLFDGVVDREDLGQAGDAEDLEDALLGADQAQRALVGAHPLEATHEHAETGGVEELDALHVDHDVVLAGAHEVDQLLAQLGSGVDVDLASDDDNRAVPFGA